MSKLSNAQRKELLDEAYLVPQLEIAKDDDHGYVARSNCNIGRLLEKAMDGELVDDGKPQVDEDGLEFPFVDENGRTVDKHQDAMDRAERGEMTYAEAEELGIDIGFDDTEDDEPDYFDNLFEEDLD